MTKQHQIKISVSRKLDEIIEIKAKKQGSKSQHIVLT